jgi:hypothetical protein
MHVIGDIYVLTSTNPKTPLRALTGNHYEIQGSPMNLVFFLLYALMTARERTPPPSLIYLRILLRVVEGRWISKVVVSNNIAATKKTVAFLSSALLNLISIQISMVKRDSL